MFGDGFDREQTRDSLRFAVVTRRAKVSMVVRGMGRGDGIEDARTCVLAGREGCRLPRAGGRRLARPHRR